MEQEELIKKYNIDVEKLKAEQEKLAKQLEIKDKMDFSGVEKVGAVTASLIGNKIIAAVIVCDRNYEVLEQEYFVDKIRFPYLPEFLAYRDLPAMVECFQKLNEKPEIVFVSGQGITHPRLGLASHFALSIGVPVIGVANSLIIGEVKKDNVVLNGKKIGKVLVTKEGSKPMYISPGNLISVDSAYNLCKELINLPHKLPEPLHLARKYVKGVIGELR